jgi:dTDP-4-amino-4,6-dideoxygalactose transaminase
VPSFTFPSTANAFALRGARIVFCDIRPDTLALDERQLERLISGRTRAIVPVHYAGVACDMDAIGKLAETAGIPVVEDNAHGLFGRYRGEYLGTFGSLGALSFHATKNFSCGEGGALIINDEGLIERAEMVREKGTDRVQFVRGDVELYTWRVLGSSFVMAELLAAVLRAQLEARSEISAKRSLLWNRYHANLDDWARGEGVQLPVVPPESDHPAHLFYLLLPSAQDQEAFVARLASNGVQASTHYRALHTSDAGHLLGEAPLGAPVAQDVASRLVRLPLYPDLALREQDAVIEAVASYRCFRASESV